MIILKYANKDSEVDSWINRLRELSVPYRTAPTTHCDHSLSDKRQVVVSTRSIDAYLDQLSADMEDWSAYVR